MERLNDILLELEELHKTTVYEPLKPDKPQNYDIMSLESYFNDMKKYKTEYDSYIEQEKMRINDIINLTKEAKQFVIDELEADDYIPIQYLDGLWNFLMEKNKNNILKVYSDIMKLLRITFTKKIK